MTFNVSFNYQDANALTNALKQKRQLTFGEQLQARDFLAQLSRQALRKYGANAPNKSIEAADSDGTKLLKRHGLMEVAMLVADGDTSLSNDQRELIYGVLREACAGFVQARHHHSAALNPSTPLTMAKPEAVNHVIEDADARYSIGALESAFVTLTERVSMLETRLLALESAVTSPPSESPPESAQSANLSANLKGE